MKTIREKLEELKELGAHEAFESFLAANKQILEDIAVDGVVCDVESPEQHAEIDRLLAEARA